ncbi:MAG: 23S rRNA (guanosine(2251)-2'-O)-methyltransferase RlmB [Desulfotomaculales bacterium]
MKPENLVAGRNPVREALRGGRSINKILLAKEVEGRVIRDIKQLAREKDVPVQQVERALLDRMLPGTVHQGVIALGAEWEYVSLEDILSRAQKEDPFLILLNEITDPQNLGAIIRSAEAAGAHGIVLPARRSALLTPAVARASAGAVEHLPVARVTNLSQAIHYLKNNNIWVVGADSAARDLLWDVRLEGPVALVIGGEDKGLGPLVKKSCDLLVRIPLRGRIGSLNASAAAAVLAFEVFRQRRLAGQKNQNEKHFS